MTITEQNLSVIIDTLGKEIQEGRAAKQALTGLFERIVNDHINREDAIWPLDHATTAQLIQLTGLNTVGNIPLMAILFKNNPSVLNPVQE